MSETDDLRALMEADRWIERVNAQRTHLPEITELATLETALRTLLKDLSSAQAAQAPVRTAYETSQREGERLRAREVSLDKTLSSSTANARELAALQGELQHVRELLERNDDMELEYLVALEPLDAAVEDVKSSAQPALARRSELQGVIAELQAGLDDELVALRSGRATLAEALSAALRTRYDAVMARVGTSGASQVVAGRCDGCRIALSPLDVDRWKGQGEGTFMPCPECGRLLLP